MSIDSLDYSFSLQHTIQGNEVVIDCSLSIGKLYFTAAELEGLASAFSEIRKAFNQNIIITSKK
jgi:hypothetical protein